MKQIHVSDVYAPHVGPASAVVVPKTQLQYSTRLRDGFLHWSTTPADGVEIEIGTAFAMCAAGCATLIASGGEHMIVAHAGRDSLVERATVEGKPKREQVSVVFAIIDTLGKQGIAPHEIAMHMLFAIPPHARQFDHPDFGTYNQALANYISCRWPGGISYVPGGILVDIETLFVRQAEEAGVRKSYVSNSLVKLPWLAHTYDGGDRARRNLFIVKRLA